MLRMAKDCTFRALANRPQDVLTEAYVRDDLILAFDAMVKI